MIIGKHDTPLTYLEGKLVARATRSGNSSQMLISYLFRQEGKDGLYGVNFVDFDAPLSKIYKLQRTDNLVTLHHTSAVRIANHIQHKLEKQYGIN